MSIHYDINTDHTKRTATKRVSSGKYLDLANLTVDDVDIKDISNALNHIYRFTGHFRDKEPLTVAQHLSLTVILANLIFPNEKDVEFDCLLHDMPEAYTGDIATPLKKMFGQQFKDYEKSIEEVVYKKLWVIDLPFNEEVYGKRKICDYMALDIERRAMWVDQSGKSEWPKIPNERFFTTKEKQTMFDTIQADRFVDLELIYNDLIEEINGKIIL